MNCTSKEFEKKLLIGTPHVVLYHSSPTSGRYIIYAYDTDPGQSHNSWNEQDRYAYSRYVWEGDSIIYGTLAPGMGSVVKDTDGLFSSFAKQILSQGNGTVSTSPGMTTNFYTGVGGGGYSVGSGGSGESYKSPSTETKSPKCECGAHSLGSNSHSDWCQLKELS